MTVRQFPTTEPRLGNCQRAGFDPERMFPKSAAMQYRAARVCNGCPIVAQCLAFALETREEHGVWGGRTENQRRALLRRHPDADWRALLAAH